MDKRHRFAAVWAVAVSLALPASTQPVFAQDSDTSPKVTLHKRQKVHRPPYSRLEQYRSSDFVGQFPGSCAYDRAAGNCMMDLGYGRCMPCSAGPMN